MLGVESGISPEVELVHAGEVFRSRQNSSEQTVSAMEHSTRHEKLVVLIGILFMSVVSLCRTTAVEVRP